MRSQIDTIPKHELIPFFLSSDISKSHPPIWYTRVINRFIKLLKFCLIKNLNWLWFREKLLGGAFQDDDVVLQLETKSKMLQKALVFAGNCSMYNKGKNCLNKALTNHTFVKQYGSISFWYYNQLSIHKPKVIFQQIILNSSFTSNWTKGFNKLCCAFIEGD